MWTIPLRPTSATVTLEGRLGMLAEVGAPLTTTAAFATTIGVEPIAVAKATMKKRAMKLPIVVFVFIVLRFLFGVESELLFTEWTESPFPTVH